MEELETIAPSLIPKTTKVFVNGIWLGIHRDPQSILDRRDDFDTDISLVYDIQEKELRMWVVCSLMCDVVCVVMSDVMWFVM